MKPCPVRDCGALIRDQRFVCYEDWKRLPGSIRADLAKYHATEPGSDRERVTQVVALNYLNRTAPMAEAAR